MLVLDWTRWEDRQGPVTVYYWLPQELREEIEYAIAHPDEEINSYGVTQEDWLRYQAENLEVWRVV
jgi:hypothetical protein